jgi:hypothetical protein
MEDKKEKIFATGIFFDLPSVTAPEWVKGRVSFRCIDAIKFLEEHQNNAGYCSIDLKVGQSGKPYAELNQYVPEKPQSFIADASNFDESDNPHGIPF